VLKRLGADHIINYREDATWGITARKFTSNGEGVDHIVEVIGADTMTQSLKAVKFEGIITVIGLIEAVMSTRRAGPLFELGPARSAFLTPSPCPPCQE
jgi:NADPH:quinone reductase-like Zn-dependent oxidoreductase